MTIDDAMKKIAGSTVLRSLMGTAFQLGLPMFRLCNGELFLRFCPHIERYTYGKLNCFSARYELEFVYPFCHLVLFRNLSYGEGNRTLNDNEPACSLSTEILPFVGQQFRTLFSKADRVLACRETGSDELSAATSDYMKCFKEIVESTGLEAVYGGFYASNSGL